MAWKPGDVLKITRAVSLNLTKIRENVFRGVGAEATYDELRATTIAGRRQNVLDVYRAVKTAYDDPSVYIPVDLKGKPDERLIPYAKTRQGRAYKAVVQSYVYDRDFQVVDIKTVSVLSDELLDVEDYLAQGRWLEDRYLLKGQDLLESKISRITFSAAPTL